MSNLDEEPYSGIFTSLKHPVRRKILRLLSERPRSFSEILESLGVSSSYLTYHLENLGQLVSKMDDGKYTLSIFGEAAVGTMSKVEDIPRATPPPSKDSSEVGSSKWSKPMQLLTNIYTLVLVGTIILAGIYFVNFNTSHIGTVVESHNPVLVQPNGTFTYKMAIVFKSGGNTQRVGVLENDTHYYDFGQPYATLTSWGVLRLWAMLMSNQSFYAWTTTYYPDGHNETYVHEGAWGTGLIDFQEAQAGMYRIEIRNISSQDMHAEIELHLEQGASERPYFFYGIWTLFIASASPLLFAFRILKRQSIRN